MAEEQRDEARKAALKLQKELLNVNERIKVANQRWQNMVQKSVTSAKIVQVRNDRHDSSILGISRHTFVQMHPEHSNQQKNRRIFKKTLYQELVGKLEVCATHFESPVSCSYVSGLNSGKYTIGDGIPPTDTSYGKPDLEHNTDEFDASEFVDWCMAHGLAPTNANRKRCYILKRGRKVWEESPLQNHNKPSAGTTSMPSAGTTHRCTMS